MKPLLVSLAVSLVAAAAMVAYTMAAPAEPLSRTVGEHPAGSATLLLHSVRPFAVGDLVVVSTDGDVALSVVDETDRRAKSITLKAPVPFALDGGDVVAHRRAATPAAVFHGPAAVRRFPRTDSRVFAYAQSGMSKEAIRLTPGWVKILIAPREEAWVLSAHASLHENGVAVEAVFERPVPFRRTQYDDEGSIAWEGYVVEKRTTASEEGVDGHALVVANDQGERRTVQLPKAAWDGFVERDYVIDRVGKPVREFPLPMGFAKTGPPYEVLDRDGEWMKIQLRDQGWVERAECELDVRYSYTFTRRQLAKEWLMHGLDSLWGAVVS